jgi:hypothetical protein
VGLADWTFSHSSLLLDGNAAGYQSSTSFSGSTFSLTTEGDQSYNYLQIHQSFPGGSFTLLSRNTFHVPAYGTLTVDLSRPGGTIFSRIPVKGGQLRWAQHSVSGSDAGLKESYSSQVSSWGTQDGTLPMVAGEGHTLSTMATVSVFALDGTILCEVTVPIPDKQVSVPPGGSVVVMHEVQVSTELCKQDQRGSLAGRVELFGLPGGLSYSSALVSAYGPQHEYMRVTHGQPVYRLTSLPPGHYWVAADAYFQPPAGAEAPSGHLHLPDHKPLNVEVFAGQETRRDFLFQGVLLDGTFPALGFLEARLQSRSLYFSSAGGDASAGGYATFAFKGPLNRNFQAVLTPGTWGEPEASFRFTETTTAQQVDLSYISRYGATFTVPEGERMSLPKRSVYNGQASILFDVREEEGATAEVLISDPWVQASRVHPVDGDYATVTATRGVQNKAKPKVMIFGPRGTYKFTAYATINGTRVRFTQSEVEIGTLLSTPTGSQVSVELRDGAGALLPVTLLFDTVEQEGYTTASLTDTGPQPPTDYELLEIVGGAKYLELSSTATTRGEVEVHISYDPALLGLTAEQEARLELHQFVCETEETCRWVRISQPSLQSGGSFTPVTSQRVSRGISGRTSTLGQLALLLPKKKPVPPSVACVGTPSAPLWVGVAPGTCGLRVDAATGAAGGCAAGSSDLASCSFNEQSSLWLGLGTHAVVLRAVGVDQLEASCTSYLFVRDAEPPRLVCPAPRVVECSGASTAVPSRASCSDNCTGTCSATCDPSSFVLGAHAVTCSATDAAGNGASCESSVTVVDRTPPLVRLTAQPDVLWPPNHKLHPISLRVKALDVCDPHPRITCTAESSEPDNGQGDGQTDGDILWRAGQLFLRAERSGRTRERVYTITCTSRDGSGNSSTGVTRVKVP